MITVEHLTKRYGDTVAVDDLSFEVRPGHVTGFLGPNGSGKSTTMRVVLGLDLPTSGAALVNGRPYRQQPFPLRSVGALLDAGDLHPGRTAADHLEGLAASNGIDRRRIDEVLGIAGLADVAGRRAGGFSLGMRQRLGVAAALLGDPDVLLFDEPVNGLDTDGIRWIRGLMRRLADEGRTVLVSSHLMSEMELMADRLVVIGRGRLIAATTVADLVRTNSQTTTRIRSPRLTELTALLAGEGATAEPDEDGSVRIIGLDPSRIGDTALAHGIALHELTPIWSSLEDVYTQVTDASVQYRGHETDQHDMEETR